MATKADVAKIALQAAQQHIAGDSEWTHGGFTFDLAEGGWCARFVMQVHECVLGIEEGSWDFHRGTARLMERALRSAGLATSKPQPGDIICLNNQSYWAGHTGIYLGKVGGVECIAENTSCASRGNPRVAGTKITPLADVIHELTAYYAPPLGDDVVTQGYASGPITIEFEGRKIDGWFTDHAIVGVRNLANLLGYEVEDDIPAHRNVVLKKAA